MVLCFCCGHISLIPDWLCSITQAGPLTSLNTCSPFLPNSTQTKHSGQSSTLNIDPLPGQRWASCHVCYNDTLDFYTLPNQGTAYLTRIS